MTGAARREASEPTPPPIPPAGRRRRWLVAAIVGGLLVAGGGAAAVAAADPPRVAKASSVQIAAVELSGLEDGSVLSAASISEAGLMVETSPRWARSLWVEVDGEPYELDADERRAGAVRIAADDLALPDGAHTITVGAGRDSTWTEAVERVVEFTIDTTAPTIALPEVIEATSIDDPLEFEVDPGDAVEVMADGADVAWAGGTGEGPVTVTYPSAPSSVVVTASDAAGNTTTAEQPVVVPFPGGVAVHTTPSAWRHAPKREPIIAMLEAGLIDAVQLDIKDELGDVSWDTDVELAGLNGSEDFNRNFDMAAAIEQIHSYGARVIGRLTVYRDHRLAQWAWENGRPDMVVQNTSGQPYAGRYGQYAFTNFAHPEVQQYNLDIALEAAELGFDDILYDYIRRPDGAIEKLVIPGLGDRTPEEAVVEVMATAYPLLRERGVWVGASVFGIAIDRPTQMAQDIPMMAEHVDYIAPMVYPNHWNLGEYGVPDPEKAPYDIVERSLALYREVLEPTGTALVPWLQDFGGYGEAEVRAQIDATEAVTGNRWFILWASSATYTESALDPLEGRPTETP